jgi:hypothetical protein
MSFGQKVAELLLVLLTTFFVQGIQMKKRLYVIRHKVTELLLTPLNCFLCLKHLEKRKEFMSFWQKVTELLLTPIDKFLYPRHSNEKKEICHLGRKSESRFKIYRQLLCIRESNKKVIHVNWAECH